MDLALKWKCFAQLVVDLCVQKFLHLTGLLIAVRAGALIPKLKGVE
jgi:hypothetical protein|tara:strand:- start:635 stop:772 length:138 start_codon:yes stop_codon:yes gene_type:complete